VWIYAAVMGSSGCGGSDTVVHIGGAANASIARGTLDHWMQATMGADFRESIGVPGPRGLVSEPADYPRCIAAAKLVAPRSFFNQLQLSRAALDRACHELYRAIKAQALGFLISVQLNVAEAAERGIKITDSEVERAFEAASRRLYPSERDLQRYLAERQWSLSDLLYQLKGDVLAHRLHPKLGGRRDRLLADTKCAPGYLVPGCNAYHGSAAAFPAPGVILERLVRKG
jgi:hypothetical protein